LCPLICNRIAADLKVDVDSVFGRLYFHLEPKYGEQVSETGKPRKAFFTPVAGPSQNCINFPLLEAVLAILWQRRRRDQLAIATAVVSLAIALGALIVSIIAITYEEKRAGRLPNAERFRGSRPESQRLFEKPALREARLVKGSRFGHARLQYPQSVRPWPRFPGRFAASAWAGATNRDCKIFVRKLLRRLAGSASRA
jgi:hypothetical protein